ncbi:MAG: OB-fold nucleic acid binding domain-containing protein, partial [Cyanobacteria bacterium J06631_12]
MTTSQRIKHILSAGEPGETLTIQGWVRTKRPAKKFTFIEINDGSSMSGLQVIASEDIPDYATHMERIGTGASVEISGTLSASPGKGQRVELQAEQITVFGQSDGETYPLQKKRHSFEFLRTIGHLRSRTNTLSAVFRVRNACANAIHEFFQTRDFL